MWAARPSVSEEANKQIYQYIYCLSSSNYVLSFSNYYLTSIQIVPRHKNRLHFPDFLGSGHKWRRKYKSLMLSGKSFLQSENESSHCIVFFLFLFLKAVVVVKDQMKNLKPHRNDCVIYKIKIQIFELISEHQLRKGSTILRILVSIWRDWEECLPLKSSYIILQPKWERAKPRNI